MIRLLQCEWKKTRRRWIFATALVLIAAQLCWALYGNYNDFTLQNGWMMFLYQLPLINAIFLPLLSVIIASRLCDIEHKGVMLKQLSVICDKGKIYDAKLLYGLLIVLIGTVLTWIVTIVFGICIGFGGTLPINLYLIYLIFTLVPTIEVYIFQHTLSLLFKNQAIPFFTGAIGTFAGLFSMFLPNIAWLRKALIWGHYGALQFVGLFGYTKETRYAEAYFEVMGIDWTFCLIALGISIALYIIGRTIFCKKEV